MQNTETNNRTCGSCHLCCKLPEIKELEKPAGVRCNFVHIGVGCSQYQIRPKACRDFTCAWLDGDIPIEFYPKDFHAFVFLPAKGEYIQIEVDPGYSGVQESREMALLVDHLITITGLPVAIRCGQRVNICQKEVDLTGDGL